MFACGEFGISWDRFWGGLIGYSFEIGGILLIEREPQLVEVDYGTSLVTPERVQDVVDKAIEVWGDKRIAVLTKASAGTDLIKLAAVVEDEALGDFTIASAIYTPSKVARVVGNLFMQLQRSPYPQLQFSDEEKALAWLRSHIAADAPRRVGTG